MKDPTGIYRGIVLQYKYENLRPFRLTLNSLRFSWSWYKTIEVLTSLLPKRGMGEFPLNSLCKNISLFIKKCGEG
jgi:hypothetical protein